MALGNYITKLLDSQLSSHESEASYRFATLHQGRNFEFVISGFDKFTYLLEKINIKNDDLTGELISAELKKRAGQLKQNVTCLQESLDIIEFDTFTNKVQLR